MKIDKNENKKNNEIVKNENQKMSDTKTQKLRRNDAKKMCEKKYYEIFFEILMIKLIDLQKQNSVMRRIRAQLAKKKLANNVRKTKLKNS